MNIKERFNNFKHNAEEKINKNKEGQPSAIKELFERVQLRSRQNTALRVYHERRQSAVTAALTAKRSYEDLCRLVGRDVDLKQIFDICDVSEVAGFVESIGELSGYKKTRAIAKVITIITCTAQTDVLLEDAEVWRGYLSKLGVEEMDFKEYLASLGIA